MAPSLTLLNPNAIDSQSDIPLHAQVRRVLRDVIVEHFEDDQRFWTEDAIIRRLDVSQGTVRRALLDLTREGWLNRRVAKGSFVRKKPASAPEMSVGVFVPEYASDLFTMGLEALASEAWRRNLRLRVYHTHNGEKSLDAFRQIESGPDAERVILFANPPDSTRDLYQAAVESGYRSVNIGMPQPRFAGDCVSVDDQVGVRLALEHLAELGHGNIALLVNEPEENPVIAERLRLFRRMAGEFAFERSRVVSCKTRFWESSYESAFDHMPRLWALKDRPSAIFAVSDQGAWAILNWAAQHGVSLPEQLSVVGYDDITSSKFMNPPLTSIAQPITAIARCAMEILWDNDAGAGRILVPPVLMARGSTGPRAQKSAAPDREAAAV